MPKAVSRGTFPVMASPLDTHFYNVNPHAYRGMPGLWRPHRSVWERLTDHQFYTGMHKERFDEFGNGRGLAGREYVYLHDGMTESPTRCHEVYSTAIKLPRKPVVPEWTLGMQCFGVQVIPPKLMWLYRNGDKHFDGVSYFMKKHVTSLPQLYQEVTKLVNPIAGPVRKLYDQNLKVVTDLSEIIDGGKYLCTSGVTPLL